MSKKIITLGICISLIILFGIALNVLSSIGIHKEIKQIHQYNVDNYHSIFMQHLDILDRINRLEELIVERLNMVASNITDQDTYKSTSNNNLSKDHDIITFDDLNKISLEVTAQLNENKEFVHGQLSDGIRMILGMCIALLTFMLFMFVMILLDYKYRSPQTNSFDRERFNQDIQWYFDPIKTLYMDSVQHMTYIHEILTELLNPMYRQFIDVVEIVVGVIMQGLIAYTIVLIIGKFVLK